VRLRSADGQIDRVRLVVQRLWDAGSVRMLARQSCDVAAGVEFVRSDLRLRSGLDAMAGVSSVANARGVPEQASGPLAWMIRVGRSVTFGTSIAR